MTFRLLTLVAVGGLCFAPPAGAEPLRLDFEALLQEHDSKCIAFRADGPTVACLVIRPALSKEVWFQLHQPGSPTVTRELLVDNGQGPPIRKAAALRWANQQLATMQALPRALWTGTHAALEGRSECQQCGKPPALPGGKTLETVDNGAALRLTRTGAQPQEVFRVELVVGDDPEERFDRVELSVHGVEGSLAVSASYRVAEYEAPRRHDVRFVSLSGCPPEARCPGAYPTIQVDLAALCAGRFDAARLQSLTRRVEAGEVPAESLVWLFNAIGAMSGHRFTRRTELNAFYYGDAAERWLPSECHGRFKAGGRPPAASRQMMGPIKDLWRRRR